jgi:hypothetical protein
MSTSPETNLDWQELDHRITSDGLDLTIRRDPTEGLMEVLVFDENGANALILSQEKAVEVFAHPNATPGIRVEAESPWDKALDAYNGLDETDKVWATRQIERDISKGFFTTTLVLDAVKRQARRKQLEQAA